MFPFPHPGPWTILGLMSGTSADGVDVAMVRVDPTGFQKGRPFLDLVGHLYAPYPDELRQRVLAAAADAMPPSELCILQRNLGEHHAKTAKALVVASGQVPMLACLHGQTVQHRPEAGATLQLADPYLLVEALQCPVVWDLRRRDMAVGGQGAPLVPKTELWLRGQDQPWIALNLGGIANATVWDGVKIQAWDLGPAMSLLDLAAQRWLGMPFDPDGAHATGCVELGLLARWLEHPYFQMEPPKSTGRETFGQAWLNDERTDLETLSLPDRLAMLAAFTAESCARELQRWARSLPPGTPLYLSGGGVQHARLREEITRRMPHFQVEGDTRFPSGAREAVSWALLGCACALGIPGNLAEATGAHHERVLGSWVWP